MDRQFIDLTDNYALKTYIYNYATANNFVQELENVAEDLVTTEYLDDYARDFVNKNMLTTTLRDNVNKDKPSINNALRIASQQCISISVINNNCSENGFIYCLNERESYKFAIIKYCNNAINDNPFISIGFNVGNSILIYKSVIDLFENTNFHGDSTIDGDLSVTGTIKSNQSNMTITHYYPISSMNNISDFVIGTPVYMTGDVFKYEISLNEFVKSTENDVTDCFCLVKTLGTWKEYVGICVQVDKKISVYHLHVVVIIWFYLMIHRVILLAMRCLLIMRITN